MAVTQLSFPLSALNMGSLLSRSQYDEIKNAISENAQIKKKSTIAFSDEQVFVITKQDDGKLTFLHESISSYFCGCIPTRRFTNDSFAQRLQGLYTSSSRSIVEGNTDHLTQQDSVTSFKKPSKSTAEDQLTTSEKSPRERTNTEKARAMGGVTHSYPVNPKNGVG
ncbi:MAG: hypothetical protein ACPGUD_03905 [Parashewanella sp.]